MDSTAPSRRRALLVITIVFAATTALVFVALRLDALPTGPSPATQVHITNAMEDDREEMLALVETLEAAGSTELPSGQLDHAGYQQFLDWYHENAQSILMRGFLEGSDSWTMADGIEAAADAIDPLVAAMRTIEPPADTRAAHERFTRSFVEYQALLERTAQREDLQLIPINDFTPYIRDEPEVLEMWHALAAIEQLGLYELPDASPARDVDAGGNAQVQRDLDRIAEIQEEMRDHVAASS